MFESYYDTHPSWCKRPGTTLSEFSESSSDPNIPEILVADQSSSSQKNGKKSKLSDSEEKDWISNLPDAILSHILSFISTKYAVRTSILSTRWRSIWTSVPNLHFNNIHHPLSVKKSRNGFMEFVERVLLLHDVSDFNKFHFGCHLGKYNPHRVNAWICTVIKRNVREVVLSISLRQPVMLPRCLFTSTNLVVLKLHGGTVFHFPMPVFLPRLKVLHLRTLRFLNDESFKDLLCGCPVLEELDITRDEVDNITTLYICSSTLKKLCVYNCVEDTEVLGADVVIKAPSLEFLRLTDHFSDQFDVDELPSLVVAELDVLFYLYKGVGGSDYVNCVAGILGKMSKIHYLRLHRAMTMAIRDSFAINDLPLFYSLTHLEVGFGDAYSTLIVPEMLVLMPHLKVLVLSKEYVFFCYTVEPKISPNYTLLCLETAEFRGFEGWDEEMELVRYLLENALVLKKLIISSCNAMNAKEETNVLKKLLMFPRGSSTCQIVFHQDSVTEDSNKPPMD